MINKYLLKLTILVHYLVFIGLTITIPLVILYQPWYMALVVVTVIVRIAFSREICPLSSLECYFQRLLGIKEKNLFVKHHVLPIIFRLRGK